MVAVPCPFEGCGSVSYWPPGGGADALLGQSLHVVMAYSQPVAMGGACKVRRSPTRPTRSSSG